MRDNSKQYLLWLAQYLSPLAVLVLYYVRVVVPNDGSIWQIIWMFSGSLLGNLLLVADAAWLYPYYTPLRTVPQRLITRSVLFVAVFALAAIFIVTSSGSELGLGLVFGIGFGIFCEMVATLGDPSLFTSRFLSQIKRSCSEREMVGYTVGFGGLLTLLALLAIR